jgi:hypothetical protein
MGLAFRANSPADANLTVQQAKREGCNGANIPLEAA